MPLYIHSILSSTHISYVHMFSHTHLICVSATSHSTTLSHQGGEGEGHRRRLVLRVLRAKTPPYIHSILSSIHISYVHMFSHTHLICVSATSHSTTLIHHGKLGHKFLLNTIISTPFSRHLLLRVKPPPLHSFHPIIHTHFISSPYSFNMRFCHQSLPHILCLHH